MGELKLAALRLEPHLSDRRRIPWIAAGAVVALSLASFDAVRGAMIGIGYGALILAGTSLLERLKASQGSR